MKNFRFYLNEIWTEPDHDNNSFFEAICELHEKQHAILTKSNTYKGEDMKNCDLGLYEIFWETGGSSLASIGNMHDGIRWIAPINWTSDTDPTGRMDDEMLKSIKYIILLHN